MLGVSDHRHPAALNTPERWQSGRMHRIRNPAYWFTSTEGSNPSFSASCRPLVQLTHLKAPQRGLGFLGKLDRQAIAVQVAN